MPASENGTYLRCRRVTAPTVDYRRVPPTPVGTSQVGAKPNGWVEGPSEALNAGLALPRWHEALPRARTGAPVCGRSSTQWRRWCADPGRGCQRCTSDPQHVPAHRADALIVPERAFGRRAAHPAASGGMAGPTCRLERTGGPQRRCATATRDLRRPRNQAPRQAPAWRWCARRCVAVRRQASVRLATGQASSRPPVHPRPRCSSSPRY